MKLIPVIAYVVIAAILLAAATLWINRPLRIVIDADVPTRFPSAGFAHDSFEELLKQYVDPDGRVRYDDWHSDAASMERLDAYLAAVARFGPDSTPERFDGEADELAYWLYAYNAYVIKAVLMQWPLRSVKDVHAPFEFVSGLGFFHRLRFEFGGRYLSLLAVEHRIIRRRYRDARIHFVLVCGGDSCPAVRPDLPDGAQLEESLATSAAQFVSDPLNVSIDHDSKRVMLSRIFKWYRRDFINDLRRRGRPVGAGLIGYIRMVADESLRESLHGADDYEIVFRQYDWSLNQSSSCQAAEASPVE